MSKKTGLFILAGVGIGLVSGVAPLTAHAADEATDAAANSEKTAADATDSAKATTETADSGVEVDLDKAAAKVKAVGEDIKARLTDRTSDSADAAKTPAKPANKKHAKKASLVAKKALSVPACDADNMRVVFSEPQCNCAQNEHSIKVSVINEGKKACSVPARPELYFLKHKEKQPLPLRLDALEEGHNYAPVVLAPSAKASAKIQWICHKAFPKNVHYKSHFVSVQFQNKAVRTPLKARFYGDKQKGAFYKATLFQVEK
ncbi:DUF4232 domain-containing protein [Acetobacteraceae bacterium]|nr:DUF4232 domain-containing protein [Acetobacteraceae bacterium]